MDALEVQKETALKKNSRPRETSQTPQARTIGLDLGDRSSQYCELDGDGKVCQRGSVATTRKAIRQQFGSVARSRVALEVGTHSRWVSQVLEECGHEVIVANPRQVGLISGSSRKNDRVDAETLARLGRVDPQLLRPVRHRSERAQEHLRVIRVRAELVEVRTALVNAVRGLAKSAGERVAKCDADQLGGKQLHLPETLGNTLRPLVEEVESLTEKIHSLDKQIEQIARDEYPETELLRQVHGVGSLIALAFVLTIDDKQRFTKSRDVGCYLGLRPRQSASGDRDPQLRISKEGDIYLRRLLVQGAHCVLMRRAPDTNLKRWGLRLCERGGKNAKKRAVVAVARKLAILLHRLWTTGEVYEALHVAVPPGKNQAAA
jgi:transposase